MTVSNEMSWDSPITVDGGYEVIPAGEYDFKVVMLEQTRHTPTPGSTGKLPECPKAIITLEIEVNGEKRKGNHNLFLHESTMGFVAEFFESIGQKKRGVPLVPNWNGAIGSTGRVKVKVKKYNGDDQNEFSFISSEKQETAKVTW